MGEHLRLALILLLISCACACASTNIPVISPSNLFTGWPWSNNVSKTWYEVDKTNRIIKQIWYSLQDRAKAAGMKDKPQYNRFLTLDAGVKTNWSYEDWALWNPGPTNNYTTNYYPRLLLTMTTNHFNAITNFSYYYPADPGTDGSGIRTNQSWVSVDQTMLSSIKTTIEELCSLYVPTSYGITNQCSNSLPVYIMAGLMIDAGVDDLVSNVARDAYGVVTNGDWQWRYPLPTSTNVIELRALDDVAACIAQLKRVRMLACASTPEIHVHSSAIGPTYYDWTDAITIMVNITNANYINYRDEPIWPFAWLQTSTDVDWYQNLTMSDTNWSSDGTTNLSYTLANHADWTNSGWYGKSVYDFSFDVSRPDANQGTGWRFTAEDVTETNGTDLSLTAAGAITFRRNLLGNVSNSFPAVALWTTSDNYTYHPASTVDTYRTTLDITNNSTYDTQSFTYTNIEEQTIPEQSREFVCTGRFQRHTNDTHSTNWIDSISFTNSETVPAHKESVYEENSQTWTVLTSFAFITNEVTVFSGEQEIPEYYEFGGTENPQTNSGTLTYSFASGANGVWFYGYMPSIRTDPFRQVLSNMTGTAYLYVAGCDFGAYGAHNNFTYDLFSEWADFLDWEYTNSNETDLTGGISIETNKYKIVWSNSIPSVATEDDSGISAIKFKGFYNAAVDSGWQPYYYRTDFARLFWGISNAVWMLDYSFPNRY